MKVTWVLLTFLNLFSSSAPEQVCYKDGECGEDASITVLYDVNPPEGFNLRRDVALRMVGLVRRTAPRLRLALPPWTGLFHWRRPRRPEPWSRFFDLDSIRQYVPIVEALDLIGSDGKVAVDVLYRLKHFDDPFEGGTFVEKWREVDAGRCNKFGTRGFEVAAARIQCIEFQGSASKLIEVIDSNPLDKVVMFANAEVALHDEYATANFWRARESFRFSRELTNIAERFIKERLGCEEIKCHNYVSVHWRRGDFVRGRPERSPSIDGTAKQIASYAHKAKVNVAFIATDAEESELASLKQKLVKLNVEPVVYRPNDNEVETLGEGGVAIVDQIICSRAARFVGTHESTFSFRIQEEREIAGFDSDTTFNRLCPDKGECEKPSRWKIVH